MKKFIHGVCSFAKRVNTRIAFAIAAAFASVSAFAEGGSSGAYDMTILTEISGKLEATLTQFWTGQKDVILLVVGIIVLFSLIWLVAKLWKRGTSKA